MVFFEEEDVQTLVKLGLNGSQAKIYLTLVSLGVANAKIIAQTAGIDRGETYRQLENLQEKTLIEKILGVPVKCKPMTIDHAIAALLQQKNRENAELQQQAEVLLKKKVSAEPLSEMQNRISVIPQREYLVWCVRDMINRAEREIVWYTQIERIPIALSHYSAEHKKAADRGVRIRVIAELNKPTNHAQGFIQRYKTKNTNFLIRFANPTLLVTFAICDGEVMDIFTEVTEDLAGSRALCSNNRQIIKVLSDYFELRWTTAMTEYPRKQDQ